MNLLRNRFGVLLLLAALFLVAHSALRVALAIASGAFAQEPAGTALALAVGVVSDLYPLALVMVVPVLWIAVLPARVWHSRTHRTLVMVFSSFVLVVALIEIVAEWLFWAEFELRFNFLAVEYLVYRREVIRNILESYSVPGIIGALAAATLLTLYLLRRAMRAALDGDSAWPARLAVAALAVIGAIAAAKAPSPEIGHDARARELAKNGIYQFAAAFRANELDYQQFYLTLPAGEAMKRTRQALGLTPSAEPTILRRVTPSGPERRLNVVMIVVESLSASFLGRYGSARGITPNLDILTHGSMWFSNMYATGTRTVRGLEALALSVPPTPGLSIVKRPGSYGLRTVGVPFQQRGYDTAFIYGGFGYFDNMNGFFSSSGFRTVDRASLPRSEVTFSNAWGVADEDLFRRVLREADTDWSRQRPFMFVTLTTSNHRPYTFPSGRIAQPQGNRFSAVKYTDWAIGRFIADARQRPWFDSTIFVIVADHCARSGGRTELPIETFRIPALIYAPQLVRPGEVRQLSSQVDLAPTLLDLLGFQYHSTFFGHSLLTGGDQRAFVASYDALGLYRDGRLTVLESRRRATEFDVVGDEEIERAVNRGDLEETIAYYQAASELYRAGAFKLEAGPEARLRPPRRAAGF